MEIFKRGKQYKMRTEEIKIYTFEELAEDKKDKAIEDLRNSEGYLDYDWSELSQEDFKEELEKLSISVDGFYWDLAYRGNFYLNNPKIIDSKEFIKKMGCEKYLILKSIENRTEEEENEFEDNLYSMGIFSEECRTEVCDFGDEDLEKELTEKLNNILDGFLKRLREDYEYLNSDEGIREHILANEFEFEENGERY